MRKVTIMTDTASNIPQELAEKFNIKVMPFHIIMDGKDYLDTEIDMDDLYARLGTKENLPTTSFPSVEEYLQVYQELSQTAEAILFISVTSIFTNAYSLALEAKEIAGRELPKTSIEVLDSRAGITHNNDPAQAEKLKELVSSQFQCDELHVFEALAPAVVHTGQGLVDFGFYSSD